MTPIPPWLVSSEDAILEELLDVTASEVESRLHDLKQNIHPKQGHNLGSLFHIWFFLFQDQEFISIHLLSI